MRLWVLSLASLSGLRIRRCCGVSLRHGSDLVLLWLWGRLAATALIRPLPWEPPYAMGVALKSGGKKKSDYKQYFLRSSLRPLAGADLRFLMCFSVFTQGLPPASDCYYDNLSSCSVSWRHWLHVIPSPLAEPSMQVLWVTFLACLQV